MNNLNYKLTTNIEKLGNKFKSDFSNKVFNALEIKNYENPLKNPDYTFHGIGMDILKLESIMQHGIVSLNEGNNKGVKIRSTGKGYNGQSFISVCDSPTSNIIYITGARAFHSYIESGISFILSDSKGSKPIKGSKGFSGFDDESHVYGNIPVSKIRGIIVPTDKLDMKLWEINTSINNLWLINTNEQIDIVLENIKDKYGYVGDRTGIDKILEERKEVMKIESYLEKDGKLKNLMIEMDKILKDYMKEAIKLHFGTSEITFRDYLTNIAPKNIPLYDIKGNLIKL